jgi:hypothetical protein
VKKLNLIVWGVPLYPLFWLLTAIYGWHLKGRCPSARHSRLVLNHAYREFWHGHNIPLSKELRQLGDSLTTQPTPPESKI